MASIQVTAQLELGKGMYQELARANDVPKLSDAVKTEENFRKQFGALRNAQTVISVVLTGETEEQLKESASRLGKAVYGPFMSQRSKVARYLIGNPKGDGAKNTGTLD